MAQGFANGNIDIDGTLAANSDQLIASQKATKTYADTKTTLAAVNAQNLSVFAATTSAQLRGVLSDEIGTGFFVTAPTITGNSLKVLRVNAGETDVEWATSSGGGITIGTTTITSGTDKRLLYNNGGVVGEIAVGANGTFLRSNGTSFGASTLVLPNTATATYIAYSTGANTIGESANLVYDGSQFITPVISGGTGTTSTLTLKPTTGVGTTNADIIFKVGNNGATEVMRLASGSNHVVLITGGTITDQKSALRITATLPSGTASSYNTIVDVQATSSNNTQNQYPFNMDLLAGGTDSVFSAAGRFVNARAGTGAIALNGWGQASNNGIATQSNPTTVGDNVGIIADARNGNKNIAVLGYAQTAKNSATNVGVIGMALNTGTSPTHVGGYFGLTSGSGPTLASAALMCDNGSTTSDIFVARDNGTAKITIADGGHLTFGDAVNVITNATTGTKIGTATSQKIGFWNATPIIQPAGATQAALAAYATGAFGLDSNANMQALYDLVVAMRTALVNCGIIKGAA